MASLWAPGILDSSCKNTSMPIKFLVSGGGLLVFLGGRGRMGANLIFMGAGLFLKLSPVKVARVLQLVETHVHASKCL